MWLTRFRGAAAVGETKSPRPSQTSAGTVASEGGFDVSGDDAVQMESSHGGGIACGAEKSKLRLSISSLNEDLDFPKRVLSEGPVLRRKIAHIVIMPWFEWVMSLVIFTSLVFVVIDVDNLADGRDSPMWLTIGNIILTVVYAMDLVMRIFVFQRRFFCDPFRIFDFVVVSVDILATVILAATAAHFPLARVMSRICRGVRVLRALRMLTIIPELNFMVKSMAFVFQPLIWGVVMLLACICFWSIFAVLFIDPLVQEMAAKGFWDDSGCKRCSTAYESVAMSMLTLCQQLVVGEGWGEQNTPVIEHYPLSAFFFIPCLVTTDLAVLNLLLGMIVESAAEAKNVTVQEETAKKAKNFDEAARELYKICRELDTDKSGRLNLEEFRSGFVKNGHFSDIMQLMDISQADLELVFAMLDADRSGELAYEEFVEQLHMMKSHDSHTLLVFIKHYITDLRIKFELLAGGETGDTTRQPGEVLSKLWGGSPSQQNSGARIKDDGSFSRQASPAIDLHVDPRTPDMSPAPSVTSNDLRRPAWPELERELLQLTSIRRELLDISRQQCDRLDHVHRRIAAGLRQDPAAPIHVTVVAGADIHGASINGSGNQPNQRLQQVGPQHSHDWSAGAPAGENIHASDAQQSHDWSAGARAGENIHA